MKKRTLKNLFALAVSLLLAGMVVACNTADDDDDDKGHSFSRVTYDANGGYFLVSYSVDEEDDFEIEEETYSTSIPNGIYWVGVASRHVKGPERTGYTLIGYTLDKDGTGTVYDKVNDRLQLTSDITLYAQWERDESVDLYTITFDANGGTGEMAVQEIATTEEYFYLRGTSFSREGYVFDGWSTRADGMGTSFPGTKYYASTELFTEGIKEVTLYALWVVNEPASISGDGIYTHVTKENIKDTLASIVESGETSVTLKMEGNLNTDFFKTVRSALREEPNKSLLVSLDLSACTGNSIEYPAFSYCSTLVSVTIPNNILSIGGSAFSGCRSLTNITIPDSVTSIGISAFSACYSLTNITIPSSVTSIGNEAFHAKAKVVYTGTLAQWCGISFGYSSFKEPYDLYLGETILTVADIPDSVTEIKPYTFYNCKSLTNVTIPNSVTSIGESAFSTASLTNITIGNGVTTIKGYAFTSSLTKVVYTGTLEQWCNISFETEVSNPCYLVKDLYFGETLLTVADIPDTITEIKPYTFYNCKSLTSVTIPNSVTAIGEQAFYGCPSLQSVTIPISVTAIEKNALSGCSSLSTVNYYGSSSDWENITGEGRYTLSSSIIKYDYTGE